MELTDTLEEYLIEQESRLNKLRSFFQDLKLAMDQAKHNREAYIGHPMNTYLMIKRLVNEWRPHVKAIQEEGDAEGKPVNSSKIKLLYGQLHRSSADKRKKKKKNWEDEVQPSDRTVFREGVERIPVKTAVFYHCCKTRQSRACDISQLNEPIISSRLVIARIYSQFKKVIERNLSTIYNVNGLWKL